MTATILAVLSVAGVLVHGAQGASGIGNDGSLSCSSAVARENGAAGVMDRAESVGGFPFGVAMSSKFSEAFVLSSGKLITFKLASGGLHRIASTYVAGAVAGLALSPDDHYLVALNGNSGGSIVMLHEKGPSLLPSFVTKFSVPEGSGAIESVVEPNSNSIVVSFETSNSVAMLSVSRIESGAYQARFVRSVKVAPGPVGLDVSPGGTNLYVVSENVGWGSPSNRSNWSYS